MDVAEILQFADQLILNKTGKRLDDLQKTVITGVYDGKTYETIADECHRSESRVRSVGRKLWQILSESLGEDVNKHNFCWTIERVANNQFILGNNNINYCHNNKEFSENTEQGIKNQLYYDLTIAPKINRFCDRISEIDTLFNWILNQTTNLISILGLAGIGKTTLVKRFIDLHQQKFDAIVWRSLKFPQSLNLLLDDLLKHHKLDSLPTINDKLKQLFDILTNKKCLIILDDVQNIFTPHQFAGKYQPEYQDYQTLFKMITETQHQSSVILMSQEQCPEMESLDEELYPIKSLELSGLENIDILKNTGLKDEDTWLNLMILYTGHPLFLKTITISIKKIFNGKVGEFLAENELVITQEMQSLFSQIFNKISPIEQQIILALSKCNQPVSRKDLKITLELSSTNFINGLESLQKRYLIHKIIEDNIFFHLSPIFREYVRNFC